MTHHPAGLSGDWIDIGTTDDVPREGARVVRTPCGEVAVFRTDAGDLHALDNRCPHRGGPLAEGIVHGHSVTCPLHNWVFDLRTGKAQGADEGCVPHDAAEDRGRPALPRRRRAPRRGRGLRRAAMDDGAPGGFDGAPAVIDGASTAGRASGGSCGAAEGDAHHLPLLWRRLRASSPRRALRARSPSPAIRTTRRTAAGCARRARPSPRPSASTAGSSIPRSAAAASPGAKRSPVSLTPSPAPSPGTGRIRSPSTFPASSSPRTTTSPTS